jgi:hypothetical protein
MEVRQAVSRRPKVQLHWLEVRFQDASNIEDVLPVGDCFICGQFGRLGNVSPAPDNDCVAALDRGTLEVRITHATAQKPNAEAVVLGTTLLAHRAMDASPEVKPLR